MTEQHSTKLLSGAPRISDAVRRKVCDDYDAFAAAGLPDNLEGWLHDRYGLSVESSYAGYPLANPWGKASGQLSMTARQVADDVDAGLGFVVLKTVIAEDAAGGQSMQAWATKESHMLAEPIKGASGERGWTISWKGRGWWQSFDDYLQLIREARRLSRDSRTLIVPSCKFHLPAPAEQTWNRAEYEFTTRKLMDAWQDSSESTDEPMPLEKDFSPTLAGSDRAALEARILEWLARVPALVRQAADSSENADPGEHHESGEDSHAGSSTHSRVRIGLKLFNALFDDEFQLEMLRAIHRSGDGRPDFFVYGNRLFDADREFEGHRGIAYGGPDLSDRNLRVMSRFQEEVCGGNLGGPSLPWSATGNITSGRTALEYALRGASSFQMHTFFQLPGSEYRMKVGNKVQKALHELYFHPDDGFIVWMHHLAEVLGLASGEMAFRDVVGKAGDVRSEA